MHKVVHLTTVHSRGDVRIFRKMCRSILNAGYEVHLVIADGEGDSVEGGVHVHDVGASKGRLARIFMGTGRVQRKAVSLDADLYHLHDPELMSLGRHLKKLGKTVVFDAHEDFPKQILSKPYLGRGVTHALSLLLVHYEHWFCRRFDGVIAATPSIRDKFFRINPETIDVKNYPISNELAMPVPWKEKKAEVCYVGGISTIRGIREVVDAIAHVRSNVILNLCGTFNDVRLQEAVRMLPGWRRVDYHGFVDRAGIREVFSRSIAGLVTLHPIPNYLDALPIKMFEYMSAGVPVIASDFPLWREIVAGNQCGFLVDPFNTEAIAEAIDYLAANPQEVERMGENGRKAVADRYNWDSEERKLLALYDRLFS